MKENKDILHVLREEAENIEIPKSISPEEMRHKLEHIETAKENEKQKRRKSVITYTTAAAGICLLLGGTYLLKENFQGFTESEIAEGYIEQDSTLVKETIDLDEEAELLASIEYPKITYEDIYESMFGNWEEMKYQNSYRGDMPKGDIVGEESFLTDGAIPEAPASDTSTNIVYKEAEAVAAEKSEMEYGTTNVQTEGVEEADVVKNDGRYLYQIVYQEKENIYSQAIQIVDTKERLEEVKRIEGFENIQEFYVWEDTLVVVENKYLEDVIAESKTAGTFMYDRVAYKNYNRQYHEISFYNIKERNKPYKIKTFTLKGSYDSSRIADGYFYGFSKYYANPGEDETDYDAYIPQVDGVRLTAEQILLPDENDGNCYLVITSVDMTNPIKFTETTAVVTDSNMYYVSGENIYIADSLDWEKKAGKQTNRILLHRFSYKDGKISLQSKGEVPGSLESSFSMDEYQGNLRMVTTVNEYLLEEVKYDITGEIIGMDLISETQSNALYVLNSDLEIVGKIENLAKDERIYSARFLGDTGYFVTFRQTDPLFVVDLKDPKVPKILSELKISGFSEYLHFYGENRLLGIGMEADEETGRTQGIKLSMFDISNPTDVQEITKLNLSNYNYSEALYNHRAVMISTSANIFGFEMEGYNSGNYQRDYVVFTYENEQFVEEVKIETNNKSGYQYSSRGTFIGNMFYLLTGDGSVESYDLETGKLCDSLIIEK